MGPRRLLREAESWPPRKEWVRAYHWTDLLAEVALALLLGGWVALVWWALR